MNGIMRLLRGMSRRTLTLTLALVLSLGAATGGTLAWLVDQTDPVKNTFTYGDVHIDLQETDESDPAIGGVDDGDGNSRTNTYKMMPGKVISKRPWVTVFQGTEDCYVFVQIEESANFDDFMTYEAAEGWLPLEGVEGAENVYYREVNAADVAAANAEYEVLKDNVVKVKESVTTEMLRALNQNGIADYPTLTFTAYAVQRDAAVESISTPAGAWATMQAENAADSSALDQAGNDAENSALNQPELTTP